MTQQDKPIWRQAHEATKQGHHAPEPAAERAPQGPMIKPEKGSPLANMLADLDQSKPLAAHKETIPAALKEAFERAESIKELRRLLTDEVMSEFYPLMNTPLGFRTDRGPHSKRNPEPYSISDVRTVFIQALLWGLPLIGNMFNIIAGQCYITVDGFGYLLQQLEKGPRKVTDMEIIPEVPRRSAGGALVSYTASWRQNGTEQGFSSTVPVRTDDNSTVDQILGKAMRKMRARVYQVVTGTVFTRDGDVDELEEDLSAQDARRRTPAKPAAVSGPIKPLSETPTPQEGATGQQQETSSGESKPEGAPWND